MAERLPYTQPTNSWVDILRQAALVSGAGLSKLRPVKGMGGLSTPDYAPLGALLSGVGALIGEGQKRRRENTVQSIAAQIGLGELDLAQGQRQLAERGYFTPDADQRLRDIATKSQLDKISQPTLAYLAGQQRPGMPTESPGLSPVAQEMRQLPPGVLGPPQAPGPSDVAGPPRAPISSAAPFLRPTSQVDDASSRINRLVLGEDGSGDVGGVTQLALALGPQAGNLALGMIGQQQARKDAMAQAERDRLKFEREKAREAALGAALGARMEGAPIQVVRQLALEAKKLGASLQDVRQVADPSSMFDEATLYYASYLSNKDPMTIDWWGTDKNLGVEIENLKQLRKDENWLRLRQLNMEMEQDFRRNSPVSDLKSGTVYIDMVTGVTDPLGGQSLNEMQAQNEMGTHRWVGLTPNDAEKYRGLKRADVLLDQLIALSKGGKITDPWVASLLNVPVGTVMPGLYLDAPDTEQEANFINWMASTYNRVKESTKVQLSMWGQAFKSDRQRRAFNAILSVMAPLIVKGPAGDSGAVTDDATRQVIDGFPTVVPDIFKGKFIDTLPQADLMFDGYRASIHNNLAILEGRATIKGGITPGLNKAREKGEASNPASANLGRPKLTTAKDWKNRKDTATMQVVLGSQGAPSPGAPSPGAPPPAKTGEEREINSMTIGRENFMKSMGLK